MKINRLKYQHGFGLLELTVAIIILGIILAVAMQSMTTVVQDTRRVKTERELELLSKSIVGDPDITQGGGRTDFGYVGDIGAFPTNLDALYTNPGAYSTWKGPYLPPGITQDSTGLKTDEWGTAYNYSGGVTITSTGGGSTLAKKIARTTSDYLLNTINGQILDLDASPPGAALKDSVDINITFPNGSGGNQTKVYHPDSSGNFALDSIPVGTHPLKIIYTPNVDTIFRYLTVYPRHKSDKIYRFASNYFFGGGGSGCDSSGTIVLRPNGAGSLTNLANEGCTSNWQCIDDITSDADATRLVRASNSFATDIYNFENPAVTTCPVLSVTVYCRARLSQSVGEVQPIVYLGGTQYPGTAQTLTSAYSNYNHQWATNPNTGSAWTWAEITNLQAGLSIRGQNSNFPAYCTQIWVEVAY